MCELLLGIIRNICDFLKFRPVDEMQLRVFFYFLLWRSLFNRNYLYNLVEGIMGNIHGQWLMRSCLNKKKLIGGCRPDKHLSQ